jgi:hypothetical protein
MRPVTRSFRLCYIDTLNRSSNSLPTHRQMISVSLVSSLKRNPYTSSVVLTHMATTLYTHVCSG